MNVNPLDPPQNEILSILPDKTSYKKRVLIYASLGLTYQAIFFFLAAIITYEPIFFMCSGAAFVYWLALWIHISAAAAKEKYVLKKNTIIQRSGGVFSDDKTELPIDKITYVKLIFPFFTRKHKTGVIVIESAGSGDSEICLNGVHNPEKIFSHIVERMKENGFSMSMENPIVESKPAKVGGILDGIFSFLGSCLSNGFWLALIMFFAYTSDKKFSFYHPYVIALLTLITIKIFVITIFNYKSTLTKKYKLYEGVAYSSEEFIDKEITFLPLENLSDCNIMKGIPQKIFGIQNMSISCQGAGRELIFEHIENADSFQKKISELRQFSEESNREQSDIFSPEISHYRAYFSSTPALCVGLSFIITNYFFPGYWLNWSAVFCFALAAWHCLKSYIILNSSKYNISNNHISKTINFISSHKVSFSRKYITQIEISRNIFDRIFHTFTVKFSNVGSDETVSLRHIKDNEQMRRMVFASQNFHDQKSEYLLSASSNIKDLLLSHPLLILIGISLTVFYPVYSLSILAILLSIIYIHHLLYCKNAHIELKENNLVFYEGYVFRCWKYISYENIKNLTIAKYPLSNNGSIFFDIAGDTGSRMDQFEINHVKNIKKVENKFHKIIKGDCIADKLVLKAHPRYAYQIISPIIIFITVNFMGIIAIKEYSLYDKNLFVPMLVCLLIIDFVALIISYYSIISEQYEIYGNKIIRRSGIIIKNSKTIYFQDIDHIKKHSGVFQRLFDTENIIIETTASSEVEMELQFIQNSHRIYNHIKKRCKKS